MQLKHLCVIATAEEFQKFSSSEVFCFCLSFVRLEKSYLDLMFIYNKHMYSQKMIDFISNSDQLPWYENRILLHKIKTYSANFKDFSMENQSKKVLSLLYCSHMKYLKRIKLN